MVDRSCFLVVTPCFALREVQPDSLELPRTIVLFANNVDAHGYKLKGSEPSLNRAVCRLMHLDPKAIDSFPLLVRRDGVYVADLSLIAEKYRLDPGRCEEILDRLPGAWLAEGERTTVEIN